MNKSFIFYFHILLICFGWLTSVNAQVLSNEKITVSVGNQQSWTGRNGTGNLSYYGCDNPPGTLDDRSSSSNLSAGGKQANGEDNCIYLTGGKITCRDGFCRTIWQNKNYSYVLSSPISNSNNKAQVTSTLTIYSDSKVVLEEKLNPKPFDNIKY